jgi:hypothetical protein
MVSWMVMLTLATMWLKIERETLLTEQASKQTNKQNNRTTDGLFVLLSSSVLLMSFDGGTHVCKYRLDVVVVSLLSSPLQDSCRRAGLKKMDCRDL